MASVSIRKNDQVKVIAGRDRGKQGRVLKMLVDSQRAIVEGINKIKKHTRANPSRNVKGGIVERETSIHVSNLVLLCPECGKATRVGHSKDEAGRKTRVCKKCRSVVERKAAG